MSKSILLTPLLLALLGGAVWGLVVASSKPKDWSNLANQRAMLKQKLAEKAAKTGEQAPDAKSVQESAAQMNNRKALPAVDSSKQSAARAEAVEPTYDFGSMNPFKRQRHTFIIRNLGTETLSLRPGPTTCKCTACNVLDKEVAPGGEGRVELEWKSVGRQELYRHSARVFTNDPLNSDIRLVVQGAVRTHLGAEPAEFVLPRVNPLAETIAQTTIYSQAWDAFTLTDFETSLTGLKWEILPPDPFELKRHGAKSGHLLQVTLPANMPSGEFRDWLRFKVRASEAPNEEPLTYEIDFDGKVLRRLVIHGEGIDKEGIVHLGVVNPNEGLRRKFLMKVNDPDLDLKVQGIKCRPAYVQAVITPYRPEGKDAGLYYLELTIPQDIPQGAFTVKDLGELHMDFGHPRVEDTTLSLEFAVSPPE